jgi:hypothetical protein
VQLAQFDHPKPFGDKPPPLVDEATSSSGDSLLVQGIQLQQNVIPKTAPLLDNQPILFTVLNASGTDHVFHSRSQLMPIASCQKVLRDPSRRGTLHQNRSMVKRPYNGPICHS